MIRYKITARDSSVQVEFESMCELFQYLEYKKKEEFMDAEFYTPERVPEGWKNTID